MTWVDEKQSTFMDICRDGEYLAVKLTFPEGYVRMRITGAQADLFAQEAARISDELGRKRND